MKLLGAGARDCWWRWRATMRSYRLRQSGGGGGKRARNWLKPWWMASNWSWRVKRSVSSITVPIIRPPLLSRGGWGINYLEDPRAAFARVSVVQVRVVEVTRRGTRERKDTWITRRTVTCIKFDTSIALALLLIGQFLHVPTHRF